MVQTTNANSSAPILSNATNQPKLLPFPILFSSTITIYMYAAPAMTQRKFIYNSITFNAILTLTNLHLGRMTKPTANSLLPPSNPFLASITNGQMPSLGFIPLPSHRPLFVLPPFRTSPLTPVMPSPALTGILSPS